MDPFKSGLDTNREGKPEKSKVPLNKHPYNSMNNANVKLDLSSGGKNVHNTIPPGGRTPKGYANSKSIGPGTVGAHRVENVEGGRSVSRTRAQGMVIKPTNHPNKKLNGLYG